MSNVHPLINLNLAEFVPPDFGEVRLDVRSTLCRGKDVRDRCETFYVGLLDVLAFFADQ
jgi:hypothetical protein